MQGGEIFVFKMPAIKIRELADIFLKKYFPDKHIEVKITGRRAGEKIHEELIGTVTEADHIFENDRMFIIRPDLNIYGFDVYPEVRYKGFAESTLTDEYSSKDHLDAEKIKAIV